MFDSYFKNSLEEILRESEAWVTPIGDGRYFVIKRNGFNIKILGTVNERGKDLLGSIWGVVFTNEADLRNLAGEVVQ